MGSGHSNGRGITARYNAANRQLDALYDLNKKFKSNRVSPSDHLFSANKKAWKHGLISSRTYENNFSINNRANHAKHNWKSLFK